MLKLVLYALYLFLINPSFRQELLRLLRCSKSPNVDSLSDSLPNGRPLSCVSRCSSKVRKDSMVPVLSSKPSRGDNVGKALEKSKLLSSEA